MLSLRFSIPPPSPPRHDLERLREQVEGCCASRDTQSSPSRVIGLCADVEGSEPCSPSVETGAIHEWFGADSSLEGRTSADWIPPLGVLVNLVREAAACSGERRLLWIGRRCWPYPGALRAQGTGRPSLLERSMFVDPPDL